MCNKASLYTFQNAQFEETILKRIIQFCQGKRHGTPLKKKKRWPVIKLHGSILTTTWKYLNATEFFVNRKFAIILEH